MNIYDLELSDTLDNDGDMSLSTDAEGLTVWLDREDALKMLVHVSKLFDVSIEELDNARRK